MDVVEKVFDVIEEGNNIFFFYSITIFEINLEGRNLILVLKEIVGY